MQSTGLIPLISAMVHPIASLCSFRIPNNLPFCSRSREEEMIIGRVSDSPKNAYSRVSGSALSSNFGGVSVDGLIFFSE